MEVLDLKEVQRKCGAIYTVVDGVEVPESYGSWAKEYKQLGETVGLLDLNSRSRLCLLGTDRVRFLHGQVTNDIKSLGAGRGCYSALTNHKGRMQSDLNIYPLTEEILLDFETGLTEKVTQRLEQFIVSDDVQVVDVAPHYSMFSVQGPQAEACVRSLQIFEAIPREVFGWTKAATDAFGEMYLMNRPRLGRQGFDLFAPVSSALAWFEALRGAAVALGGGLTGWQAAEARRIEAGFPRYSQDMDETNLPPECGIEASAVSYRKGCYIGQEVLNRLHTLGEPARRLCLFEIETEPGTLPVKGAEILAGDQTCGVVTSASFIPEGAAKALGYMRRQAIEPNRSVKVRGAKGEMLPLKLNRVVG